MRRRHRASVEDCLAELIQPRRRQRGAVRPAKGGGVISRLAERPRVRCQAANREGHGARPNRTDVRLPILVADEEARAGTVRLLSLEEQGRRCAADDERAARLLQRGQRLVPIADAKRRAHRVLIGGRRLVKVGGNRADRERSDHIFADRFALSCDFEPIGELVRKRRGTGPGVRQPVAPLELRAVGVRRERDDEAAERRRTSPELEHPLPATGEDADDAGHDPALVDLMGAVEKERAVLLLAHDRSCCRSQANIAGPLKRRGDRDIGAGGPSQFHDQEERLAVDFRRHVGKKPRHARDRGEQHGNGGAGERETLREAGSWAGRQPRAT